MVQRKFVAFLNNKETRDHTVVILTSLIELARKTKFSVYNALHSQILVCIRRSISFSVV